ncbi:hypothetical protein, partial [Escherichia coli]|uniref:hypothetical protein n=1 Tax=Escherichia coli TaxID=562 RepID=UPI0031B62906
MAASPKCFYDEFHDNSPYDINKCVNLKSHPGNIYLKIFSTTPDRKNTTTGGGVSLGRLYLIRAIAFLS